MSPGNHESLVSEVTFENSKQRLDKYLATQFPDISRNRVQSWIEDGNVLCNGKIIKDLSHKVVEGEIYTLLPPPLQEAIPKAQVIDLDIIYEDSDLLVINKAPGMVVHPAPGHHDSTLVNALLAHCGDTLSGIGDVKRPGIVHRLDKDTSGLMVVAKNDAAHNGLAVQFSVENGGKQLVRTYSALVWGYPHPLQGTITTQIGRHPKNRQKMAVVKDSSGKKSITHYTTKKLWGFGPKEEIKISWLEFKLETGRTHQIRVHSHFIGHPVVGDPLYGRKTAPSGKLCPQEILDFKRQALHAVKLQFIHPVTKTLMQFEAPLPGDIQQLMKILNDK
ncbi:MAG: RluA family pseudouridine synthase [Alphaproteobacteria bacterium]|nr:RluA family pseudouridine synthase [Alphaproteobacteria bacterium]